MNDLLAKLAELSPQQRELLLRQLGKQKGEAAPERIPRQPRADAADNGEPERFAVSFSQLREWILDRLEPGNPAYNIPGAVDLSGALDLPTLLLCVDEIVRRHESLRTTFAATDGEPVQVVAPSLQLAVPVVDISALPREVLRREMSRLVRFEHSLPFDLARGPLLRVSLLRLAPEQHAVIYTMHHIISDGWSLGIFLREMGTLYDAFSAGKPSPLPELPIQYPDYAVWQRGWLQGELLEQHLGFWREQLAGAPPLLTLPTDRPRPPVQGYRGAARSVVFNGDLVRALRTLGQREGATLFMAFLAGYQAFLARYSGQDDVSVGTYSANRDRTELEGLIGFFINTLVLRTQLEDRPTFRALTARVRKVTVDAFAHQALPFEKILEALRIDRNLSHTPLFQTLLVLQNFPKEKVQLEKVALSPLVEEEHVNFDLSLWLAERGGEVGGTAQYNTDLFEDATVERMMRHLAAFLEAAVREPDRAVHDLPILSPAERDQLLGEWSGAAEPPPVPPDLPLGVQTLVAAQAQRAPDAVAVEASERGGGLGLTYRELEERSNRLARHLRRLGIGPEVRVGLSANRSPEMLAGMLAVLKAGGAYLPLDPSYPEERLAWMLADSGAPVLLTQSALASRWATASGDRRVVLLDDLDHGDWTKESAEPLDTLNREISPRDPAYVIYTSGSTGRPKGVVVEHRSLVSHAVGAAAAYGIEPGDRVLQFASISFDTSVEEIYPCLAAGATLVLRPDSMLDTVPHFLAELARLRITVLDLPTAYWHELAAASPAALPDELRLVILGGEKALAERLAAWREIRGADRVRLVNTYGPTEATVVATRHEVTAKDRGEIPIGRPAAGARVYVVDARFHLVAPGVAGELLVGGIGGVGLARGYLGRPELTAAAFVPDPYSSEPGERLYRTGDRVRHRTSGAPGADAVLEFLGRVDGQVKIRGFRIEPGEVESALSAHPGVRAAAVAVHEETTGTPRLVGYVVPIDPEEAPNVSELRRFLAARLPEHMIPPVFVPLAELPLAAGGKVDRRALPAPEGGLRPQLEREYLPPESPVEEALAAIWSETLGVEQIGVQDNFFELGGHSLLATQVVARVRERLQVDLQLITLFQLPTIEQLAVAVEEMILDKLEELDEHEVQALL